MRYPRPQNQNRRCYQLRNSQQQGRMEKPFAIHPEDEIMVTPNEVQGTPQLIQIKYATMLNDLDVDDVIFINDGIIKLRVTAKTETALKCICEAGIL